MKLIVELNSTSLIKTLSKNDYISHLLIGIKGLSLTPSKTFEIIDIEKIFNITKNTHLKLILNAERLFSDYDLIKALEILDALNLDFFEYITYSDFGFYNLLVSKGLKNKLVFRAPTYLTNACDVNLYNEENEYIVLSSKISSSELIELSKKCNKNVIIDLFGKTECFYSRRNLLSNYFIYRNTKDDPNKKNYKIQEEIRSELQPIIEDETGTHIFETNNHYLLEELDELKNVQYGIVHTNFLKNKDVLAICNAYSEYFNSKDNETFYKILKSANIDYYKGAYDIKSVLLKGDNKDE